jgi:hypothetical protein
MSQLLGAVLFASVQAQSGAPVLFTPADVLEAMAHTTPIASCVVRREIGGVGYNPYAVSRTRDRGPIQLHQDGPIEVDYLAVTPIVAEQLGWPDPRPDIWDPAKTIPYLAWMLDHGYGPHWMTYAGCR